jgi:hypothetical protein
MTTDLLAIPSPPPLVSTFSVGAAKRSSVVVGGAFGLAVGDELSDVHGKEKLAVSQAAVVIQYRNNIVALVVSDRQQ